jgi:hypothetical protein
LGQFRIGERSISWTSRTTCKYPQFGQRYVWTRVPNREVSNGVPEHLREAPSLTRSLCDSFVKDMKEDRFRCRRLWEAELDDNAVEEGRVNVTESNPVETHRRLGGFIADMSLEVLLVVGYDNPR